MSDVAALYFRKQKFKHLKLFKFQTTLVTEREYELPITLEEIHECSHEDDEESSRYHRINKNFLKYSHSSSTL